MCEREQIPVVLEPPSIHNIDQWQGAAIASTSRLFLPVHVLTYHDKTGTACKTFSYSDESWLSKVEKLVLDEVAGRSEPLL